MASYMITGTSRGVGLELVKQLLDLPETQVSMIFAVTRSQPSVALQALIDQPGSRVESIIIDDITDETRVKTAMAEVEHSLKDEVSMY